MKYVVSFILTIWILWACSSTKFVPEGKYLLNSVDIKSDNKNIDVSLLEDYVRQMPNSSLPLLGKLRLHLYSAAGDTAKAFSRFLQNKVGQPPVIFNGRLAELSASQIRRELWNEGYLNSTVDTLMKINGQKLGLTYDINSGIPYKIRNYELKITEKTINRILSYTKAFSGIKAGMLFNQNYLENEQTRMTSILRNLGYYSFSNMNWYIEADTTLNSHEVDLFYLLRQTQGGDGTSFKRYRFRNITILSGYDVVNPDNDELFAHPDTTYKKGIVMIHGENNFLRNSTLLRNNLIQPGKYFSENVISNTYTAFKSTGAIKQTSIKLTPVYKDSASYLDALITLVPAKTHWFETALDGTNSAGDIGVAPSVAYKQQNIFNGAEVFSVRLKGAYEFITGEKGAQLGQKGYYEYGIETSLSFPQLLLPWMKNSWKDNTTAGTQVSLGLMNQHRSQYTRQFFNATYSYSWSTNKGLFVHGLDLLDVNYVRMPWLSTAFDSTLNTNKVLKAAYDNQLIARTAYNLTYTRSKMGRTTGNLYAVRGGFEVAGLLPRLATQISKPEKNSDGQYQILGIAYAEYLKATVSFAQTRKYSRKNSFAYRIGLGVASPYGNSEIIPYERRFFGGGANGVRGWQTRRLGPGSYQTTDSTTFINQVGDISLVMSVEHRHKLTELFELATFIDAGNIWTIRNYAGQEGGLFKFNSFYKEIALSYGAGLRVDLNFLLLRLDLGIKAYDPGLQENRRWVVFKPSIKRDTALHFAIGYPF